ncbi:hypothetical protein PoB_004670200 [Plakobranchus ocellatus]|uniref:Uncharacterized protein n=1 Tax=Plakobranchus ocellatus TaxID=259542 RepID=A0AAV4BLK5_9GAST|nr:hypothetical protein PoB_004670200 [Plakobranchus ocellatus]
MAAKQMRQIPVHGNEQVLQRSKQHKLPRKDISMVLCFNLDNAPVDKTSSSHADGYDDLRGMRVASWVDRFLVPLFLAPVQMGAEFFVHWRRAAAHTLILECLSFPQSFSRQDDGAGFLSKPGSQSSLWRLLKQKYTFFCKVRALYKTIRNQNLPFLLLYSEQLSLNAAKYNGAIAKRFCSPDGQPPTFQLVWR